MMTAEKAQAHALFSVKKMVFTACLAGLAFVLNTFVFFPHMAPFQHMCNLIGDVFIGPWYNMLAAIITGLLRMTLTGCDVQALVGAFIGAWLGGEMYRHTQKLWAAWIGEVIGTGVISAMAAYPLIRIFYGFPKFNAFYLIPFYAPAAVVGASIGVCVITFLKKGKVLNRLIQQLNS
ncbi:MAG: energy coupling factor transporter S component ThiW [Lachnospiraceae bacterium]|nr:energy coupling factor transporter S component ThiW [Lachnospiraceae bacterium]